MLSDCVDLRFKPDPSPSDEESTEESVVVWAIKMFRAAGYLLVGSQLLFLVAELIWSGAELKPIIGHVILGSLGAIVAGASRTSWFREHWRLAGITACICVFASAALISSIDGNAEALFLVIIMVVLGVGAMVPWEARSEAVVGIAAILTFAVHALLLPDSDPYPLYHWLGMGTATALGYASSWLGESYRTTVAQHLAALKQSEYRLRQELRLGEQTIGERDRTQEMLTAGQATLRTIFDTIPEVVVVTRMSDGACIEVNQNFHSAGMSINDLQPPRDGIWTDLRQRDDFNSRIRADGSVHNMEVHFRRNDVDVPCLISAAKVNLNGEMATVSVVRDITEIKRTEDELRAAREELSHQVDELRIGKETFRKIFDASLDTMTLSDSAGNYLDVNDEFVRSTGFTREETIGHNFLELNTWVHPSEMLAFGEQLYATNLVRNMEVTFRVKNGTEIPALFSAVNFELNGETCCLTISRDITALKQTERDLVTAREAALTASRAKSEFLSGMSHEIRTPMNSILGMADLLAETELNLEQRRYLNIVQSNGDALLQLINGILDLARVESGRLSLEHVEIDPKAVTEQALETLAIRAHEKGLELIARFAPGVPDVLIGDPLRLGQILINLIGNAIKFTQRGQVVVTVEPGEIADGACTLKFSVSDSGIGISRDQLDTLFNPFTQADSSTSRKYGGSGLGLAIVKHFVELMQGTIDVVSQPGKGSTFSFTALFAPGAADRQVPRSVVDPALCGKKILLVDHNFASRAILAESLTLSGATGTALASRAEALSALRPSSGMTPQFDVILLDCNTPGLNARDLARIMNGWPAHPPIVAMLSTDDLTAKIEALRSIGALTYVVKPISRAELIAVIARALAGTRPPTRIIRSISTSPAPASSDVLDRPLKILLVDDSSDNRALIEAYLKKTRYQIDQAENGQQAIDQFIAGRFDLVLMDIQMPIVDGYAAVRSIRTWERDHNRVRTPIIALTASALEEAATLTFAAGCDAHVTKPVRKATLLKAIRDAVESGLTSDTEREIALTEESWQAI